MKRRRTLTAEKHVLPALQTHGSALRIWGRHRPVPKPYATHETHTREEHIPCATCREARWALWSALSWAVAGRPGEAVSRIKEAAQLAVRAQIESESGRRAR
ncbi:hypothetical protein [Microvirga massiliensis]|uniref:hypothetical protein n=1 Tax=Microvirga massiliensis TaxID=1033741 RepID=UPI00062B33A5|nr:hypothetical protein [Microvirga massiliensis]